MRRPTLSTHPCTYLLDVCAEGLQPLGHLAVGALLDDVAHHGAFDEGHLEGHLDLHRRRGKRLHAQAVVHAEGVCGRHVLQLGAGAQDEAAVLEPLHALDLDTLRGSQAGQVDRLEELHLPALPQHRRQLCPRRQYQVGVFHTLVVTVDAVAGSVLYSRSGHVRAQ